ncbi:hypothetical protein ACFS5J_08110 [Flavobacterium chuncheonense]|uniref:Roadblock/LC7 domain-containing protein n=1 Tax=Flavobacterium chuncheonense TaxID=2026653 RepID=A0ABW5YLK9_9FLAO
MSRKVNLEMLIDDIDVECGFVFDSEGVLDRSLYLDLAENFAAMSGMITTMCKEIMEDFNLGELDEIILNTNSGLFFVKKIQNNEYLGIVTKDSSKLALIHMKLQNLLKEVAA